MSSRASRRNDTTDIIKKMQMESKRNQGLARQSYSGLSSAEYGSSTSNAGGTFSTNGTIDTTGLLKTQGGTMVGAFAVYPKSLVLDTGEINLQQDAPGGTSRVILLGEGGVADDLVTINGASHAGQLLFLQAVVTTPITLKNTGNIYIPAGGDHVVAGKDIVLLQWDTVNATWTLVSGGGGGWVDTATSGLDMAGFDITNIGTLGFDVIGGQITADTGVTGMNFVTTSAVPFRFTPNATNVLDITDAGIDMIAGDIDLNNLNIIGVNDINFNTTGQQITDNANGLRFIQTAATDTFDFTTDSNLNLSIEKFFINMKNSRIQMTEEVAPSAPVLTNHLIYVDSTSKHLTIVHNGSTTDLEAGGSTSFIGFTGDDILDMNTFDIEQVGKIEFSSTGHSIMSNSLGFEFRVPISDNYEFFVNGVSELTLDATDLNVQGNNITGVGDIGFDVIGGQITADTGVTGMNFVSTSDVPFRFTPFATNILDINSSGLSMIAGDIDLNNLNIIGVNAVNFNETGQSITDSGTGLAFSHTDALDGFTFTTDSNLNLTIDKFFINMHNSRIQMTQEVAPSAPVATEHYIYVDSTSGELSILHPTGGAVSLEASGGSTSFIGFTGDDILDMNTFDIERCGQIEFSSVNHLIKSNSLGFEYKVPLGDDHDFFVNGILEFKVDGSESRFYNDLYLGSNSADTTYHNGLDDWLSNYSAVSQTAGDADGYITIGIGGVAKKLYYYNF